MFLQLIRQTFKGFFSLRNTSANSSFLAGPFPQTALKYLCLLSFLKKTISFIIAGACAVLSHSWTVGVVMPCNTNWQISPYRKSLATIVIKGAKLQIAFRFHSALNPSRDKLELPCVSLTFIIMLIQKSLTLQRQSVFFTVFYGGSQRASSRTTALLQPLNISSDSGWRPPKLWKINETNVACWTALLAPSTKWNHCVHACKKKKKAKVFPSLVGKEKINQPRDLWQASSADGGRGFLLKQRQTNIFKVTFCKYWPCAGLLLVRSLSLTFAQGSFFFPP